MLIYCAGTRAVRKLSRALRALPSCPSDDQVEKPPVELPKKRPASPHAAARSSGPGLGRGGLPLDGDAALLLLLQLDGGIEEVLNCHIIGTLLKSFGVVELVATWTRVIEFWIVMWERTGFNVD